MKEIITIGVGQCGVQLSEKMIEMYMKEHHISQNGRKVQQQTQLSLISSKKQLEKIRADRKNENLHAIFEEKEKKQEYHGRFLMIDSEVDVINSLKRSKTYNLISPLNLIAGKESSVTYARGYYSSKNHYTQQIYSNNLRRMAESCDYLESFVTNHGVQGGTGSGNGALVSELLMDMFPKVVKTNIIVNYEPAISTTPIGAYNAILGLSRFQAYSDLTILVDNYSLNQIFETDFNNKGASFSNLNGLISQIHSSYSVSSRYSDSLIGCGPSQFQISLVAFPRIHWVMPSFIPLLSYNNRSEQSNKFYQEMSVEMSLREGLERKKRMINKCMRQMNGNDEKLISGVVVMRSNSVRYHQLCEGASKVSQEKNWMHMSPDIFKTSLSSHLAINLHSFSSQKQQSVKSGFQDLTQIKSSLTSFISTLQFHQLFKRQHQFYDLLYRRRAFWHWFTKDGMQIEQFSEASEEMTAMEDDYEAYWGGELQDRSKKQEDEV